METLYLAPANHLTYVGFGWVRPWPAPWMHLHMVGLAVAGLCIAFGYRHRLAAGLFTLGFAYVELIDAALYLNHYWFMTLGGLLLSILPVHHRWSLDARSSRIVSFGVVPAGVLWALRAQIGVVYLFAGLAKLNPDWLLRAQPMRLWLADRTYLWGIGGLLGEPVAAYLLSWAAAFFDCTILIWLLWRRSRVWAYMILVIFHISTWVLFQIGVFPWVMIAATLVFFEPDWPSRLLERLRNLVPFRRFAPTPAAAQRQLHSTSAASAHAHRVGAASSATSSGDPFGTPPSRPLRLGPVLLVGLALLAVLQIGLPLRHYAYPSNVRWSEEGYYLSWRVMLTEKAGHAEFRVTDPSTGREWKVHPRLVLTDWQAAAAAIRPDLLHAAAHLVADHFRRKGVENPEVRAEVWVSMNDRPAQQMVNPSVDLAATARSLGPADWIIPLKEG